MIQNIRFNTVNPLAVKIGAAQGPKSKITWNPQRWHFAVPSCADPTEELPWVSSSCTPSFPFTVTNKLSYLKRVPIDLSPSCSKGFPLICVKKNEDKFFYFKKPPNLGPTTHSIHSTGSKLVQYCAVHMITYSYNSVGTHNTILWLTIPFQKI